MTSPPSESGDFATIAALIEKLQFDVDRGSNSREEAATALAAMGSKAVPALIDAVNFKKDVRKRAIFVLGNIGPAAKDAVSALLACLWNKDYSVRRMAAWALGEIGPVDEEVIPRLIGAMRTGDRKFRYSIFQALVTIGKEAVTALIARFSYRWEPEQLIDKALASFGMEVVPDLLAIVRGEDEELSQRAAGLLVTIGKDAVPDLMAAWKDESGVIRKEAARILMQIDPHLMITMLKEEGSGEAAAEEWDVEAVPLLRLLKRFYLLGRFYKEGVTSFRGAEDAINDQRYKLYQSFDRENIAATATSFSNIKTSPLPALFGKILGRPNISLFVESARSQSGKNRRVPTGIADRFSEEGWEAWTWTDKFLRRRLPPDWFGFSRLTEEKNSDS